MRPSPRGYTRGVVIYLRTVLQKLRISLVPSGGRNEWLNGTSYSERSRFFSIVPQARVKPGSSLPQEAAAKIGFKSKPSTNLKAQRVSRRKNEKQGNAI